MANLTGRAKKRIFVTGGTGALGSWFIRELLIAGYQIVALTRGNSHEQARHRVARVLAFFNAQNLVDRVSVVRGGLPDDLQDDEVLPALKGCTAIVHCAACTSFDAANESAIHEINVGGVRRVLNWAERVWIPVVHVSTAYVAGSHRGVMRETDLRVGQSFNNTYELTKYMAEGLLREWSAKNSIPVIVLRPSIVVGDSVSGAITSFKTIYVFLRILDRAHVFLRTLEATSHKSDRILRFIGDENATINLVPVDYCARVARKIIEHGQPGTYHITNPRPPTIANIAESLTGPILALQEQTRRFQLVRPEAFVDRPASVVESVIKTVLGSFSPYLCGEPTFDRACTDALFSDTPIHFPVLNDRFFQCLVQYARSVRWQGWLDR